LTEPVPADVEVDEDVANDDVAGTDATSDREAAAPALFSPGRDKEPGASVLKTKAGARWDQSEPLDVSA
jgi:hypothetical protein